MSTTEWKLVPVEPTEEMVRSASQAAFGWPVDWARHYRAMLAASPADDVAGLIDRLIRESYDVATVGGYRSAGTAMHEAAAALSRLQARLAEAEVRGDRMADDWGRFCVMMGVTFDTQEAVASHLRARLAEVTAERDMANKEVNLLLSSAAAKGDEPDLLLRAWHTALDDAATMREALTKIRRSVTYPVSTDIIPRGWEFRAFTPGCPELIVETIDAALGGQHG